MRFSALLTDHVAALRSIKLRDRISGFILKGIVAKSNQRLKSQLNSDESFILNSRSALSKIQ